MLIQSILLIILGFTIMSASLLDSVKNSIPIFNLVVAITTVLMLVSFKKANSYVKKETELELLKVHMENTEDLLNLLRAQRHEYLTHIQSIESLIILNEYDELAEYVRGISKEYRITNEIVRLGNPILTAVINTKKEIAEKKGILFHVKCKNKVALNSINGWELSSIVSNLIENAIEAVSHQEEKWIKITIGYQQGQFFFEIENTGKLEEKIQKDIFEPGISSKSSAGRGYGLFIVKDIIEKYNGSIEYVESQEGSVKFKIILPSEETVYGKAVI